jgi:hypothetical protein
VDAAPQHRSAGAPSLASVSIKLEHVISSAFAKIDLVVYGGTEIIH